MPIKCKKIIDGKTYNTETATELAGWNNTSDEYPVTWGEHLFQNRYGAFFLYSFQDDGPNGPEADLTPFSPEEARAWLEKYQYVDVIETVFGALPEAGSGETKFTLRMPDALRDRLVEHAKKNGQSLNAWIIRCLEASTTDPETRNRGKDEIPPMGNMKRGPDGVWRPKGQ